MKRNFVEPEIEIVSFDAEDIMTDINFGNDGSDPYVCVDSGTSGDVQG